MKFYKLFPKMNEVNFYGDKNKSKKDIRTLDEFIRKISNVI